MKTFRSLNKTRMHSSRMCTIRCSGHLSCHACPPATHAPCHTCPLPCMPPTMHAPLHHTCPPFTTHTPMVPLATPTPDRMTDACENITFPQLLLRTLKMTNNPAQHYFKNNLHPLHPQKPLAHHPPTFITHRKHM